MPRQLWLCTSEVITWTPRSLFDLLNCSHLLLTIRECQVHDLLTCLNSLHSWIECIIRLVEADVYFILSDLFYLTWTCLLVLARNCNDLLEPALVLDWWLSIVSSSYLIHEHAGDTQNSSVNLSLRTGKGLAEGLVSHGSLPISSVGMRSPTPCLGILEYYQISCFDERARLRGWNSGRRWLTSVVLRTYFCYIDGVSTQLEILIKRWNGSWELLYPLLNM